jgi:hypothetical protein
MAKLDTVNAMGAPDRLYWAEQWALDALKAALAHKERVERTRCRDIVLAYQREAPDFVREHLRLLILQIDS